VLSGDTGGETVGTTESDVAGLDTTRHVVSLCGRVDDLIDGLHGEVEGHEFALEVLSGLDPTLRFIFEMLRVRQGRDEKQETRNEK